MNKKCNFIRSTNYI